MNATEKFTHPSFNVYHLSKVLEDSVPIADLVRKAAETNDLLFLVEEVYNRWQLQRCNFEINEQESSLPYIIELKESNDWIDNQIDLSLLVSTAADHRIYDVISPI